MNDITYPALRVDASLAARDSCEAWLQIDWNDLYNRYFQQRGKSISGTHGVRVYKPLALMLEEELDRIRKERENA